MPFMDVRCCYILKMEFLIILAFFLCFSVQGQTITETFGGTNGFSIDFVTIGNPGSSADTNGWGSVPYTYRMGKYEITQEQITKANNLGGIGINMSDWRSIGASGPDFPAGGINWYEAARFVNFLNASHGCAPAYKFDSSGEFQIWTVNDVGYNPANPYRNSGAKFWIPSRDEWHKAAFGSPQGTWYDYPTGSDSRPIGVSNGTEAQTAIYNGAPHPAKVQESGGSSPWGTVAQGGNVYEWEETSVDATNADPAANRAIRGGSCYAGAQAIALSSTYRNPNFGPQATVDDFGFRIAGVPEPSALSLLAVGLGVVLRRRRRTV